MQLAGYLCPSNSMAFRTVLISFTIHQTKTSRAFAGLVSPCISQLAEKEPPVPKFNFLVVLCTGVLCAWGVGCSNEPGPIQKMAKSPTTTAASDAPVDAPPQTEPAMNGTDGTGDGAAGSGKEGDDSPKSDEAAVPQEVDLKESGITFVAPGAWKRIKPQNNIIEAEFELARVEGDEFDGRLTLMSSGGSPQEAIATRTAEFNQEPGEAATTEKLQIGGFEASLLDIRGEWKGSAFRPMPPRADYRMLLFIIPYSERSGFYAKLTGPRSTIAAHEEAFREFLHSAKITREAAK